jgi:hypothetical protein
MGSIITILDETQVEPGPIVAPKHIGLDRSRETESRDATKDVFLKRSSVPVDAEMDQ